MPACVHDKLLCRSLAWLPADVVSFTSVCAALSPEASMSLLDALWQRFDNLASSCGIFKLETVGDTCALLPWLAGPA
jgi:hypothetical protein